ncbi:MAG: NAD-dependent epimerase/dehydratase family protein [Alphaproteobacteria bacterium]|nr:MAG: NAD-dependent epimerase/dehydratase family protein [Alphaproteobacteria bacterium]
MPRTIALTGATGFIGGHILTALTARGHKVRALTRRPVEDTSHIATVTWIKGDLTDLAALHHLTEGTDAIIHCAGLVKATHRDAFFHINATAVEALKETVLKLPEPRPPFLHLSTLAAREPGLSDYAASKAAGERVLTGCPAALDWLIVRPPAVYGPGDLEILKLFKSLRYGLGLIPGSAENRVSVVYVKDLARFITEWAEAPSLTGQVVEVDDGQPGGYRLAEVYELAAKLLGRKVHLLSIPSPLLTMAAQINTAIARARGQPPMLTRGKVRELTHPDWVSRRDSAGARTWNPTTRLPEGLRATLDWYRESGLL